ncbi:MAG: TIGR03435 family protein [Bryobacteraceae bacterium]
MFRAIPGCGLIVLASCAAFAQGAGGPSFEVASIKPAATMVPGRMMIGMNGGPGTHDPGQITVTNMAVRDLMTAAFDVKSYQISGPAWMDSQRFDIVAKVPAGATKDDVKVMWQNLLKERFGLTLHHETKEMAMYALVAGKNGPKLKESVDDPPPTDGQASSAGGPAPPPPPPPGDGPAGEGRRMNITMGKDGMPQLPPGMRRQGVIMVMMNGRMRMIGTKTPISRLVETLARQYDRPVTDMTGLTKNYDFTLDFAPENGGIMKGMPMPPPGAGGEGGAMHAPETPGGEEVATLAVALQEQLGLKLEPKKGPVDLLVIDRLEKTPTEN